MIRQAKEQDANQQGASVWWVKGGDEKCFSSCIINENSSVTRWPWDKEEKRFNNSMFRMQGDGRISPFPSVISFYFFTLHGLEGSSVIAWWRALTGGFGGDELKPDFNLSVSIFTIKVMGVYWYFSGYQLVLCFYSAEYLATADHHFSSLVSLMHSEILVDIWRPFGWCTPCHMSSGSYKLSVFLVRSCLTFVVLKWDNFRCFLGRCTGTPLRK